MVYLLSMAVFVLQVQSWVVTTDHTACKTLRIYYMALYRKFAKPCSIRQDLAYKRITTRSKIQDIQNYKLFQSLDMVAKDNMKM